MHNCGNDGKDEFVMDSNPFRWKGYYYDADTKCYYINGRWYAPDIMQYLDADSPENILSLATTLNALDRNGITVDNTVNFDPNDDSIFSATELFPDPYDENADLSWWQANWANALQWITFALRCLLP